MLTARLEARHEGGEEWQAMRGTKWEGGRNDWVERGV